MHESKFLGWARTAYLAGVALATLLVWPASWFPLMPGKLLVFSLCLLISAGCFVAGGGVSRLLQGRGLVPALSILLLPIAYLLAYFASSDRSIGIGGFAIEADTVLFVVLASVTFLLGFALFKTPQGLRGLMRTLGISIGIAAVFQAVLVVFGQAVIPFSIFNDHSVNLVGKWNDLGLLLGLLMLGLVLWVTFVSLPRGRMLAYAGAALASALVLGVVHFSLAWSLLLGFFAVVSIAAFLAGRGEENRSIPWIPLGAVAIAAVFLFWGSVFNTQVTRVFPVSAVEVRPALSSTLDVIRDAHGTSTARLILGTGPQTFGQQWLLYKPAGVNQSPFWNLDFTVGFSTLATALCTVGIIGFLAWLLPLLLVLRGAIRVLRSPEVTTHETVWALGLATAALYMWSVLLLYVPSQNVILLAFALCGASLGFSMQRGSTLGEPQERGKFAAALLGLLLVLLSLWVATTIAQRFMSQTYANKALAAIQAAKPDEALAIAGKARSAEQSGDALRASVDAGVAKLQQIASTKQATAEVQREFTQLAQDTIGWGQQAIARTPQDYRAYLSLGRVYDLLASIKVGGAYENAVQTYARAQSLNPRSPQIPLALARLHSAQGKRQETQDALKQALTLKPDYTDAILFIVQLEVANKDIPNAIVAAQAAARSAPGVPVVWFELGLLFYTANDATRAAAALEEAVRLEPSYANAKYFLGLSYAALNRKEEAIAQFRDLVRTNPGNAEIALILSNLEAGNPPFKNAEPPITSTPQNRPTAPISQ